MFPTRGSTADVPGNAEYLVDGVPVTLNFGHTVSNATPSYDDVAEFKVVTNGIDAQYGRLSGRGGYGYDQIGLQPTARTTV